MKKFILYNLIKITLLAITVQTIISCNSNSTNENTQTTAAPEGPIYKSSHVMTIAEQDSLTPNQVLQELKDGNERFNAGNVIKRELSILQEQEN
jgi:hypothetical protein